MGTSKNSQRHADTESSSAFSASPRFQEIAGRARNDGSVTNRIFTSPLMKKEQELHIFCR
jgi:hypothetical protein